MSGLESKIYAFLPLQDQHGQKDIRKIHWVAKFFSRLVTAVSVGAFAFYVLRVFWCYKHLNLDGVYYGLMGALTSQLGLQAMSVAFSILYVTGVNGKQQSFVFLWIISIFVLLSLETVIVIYSGALKDHANIPWDSWSLAELLIYIFKFIVHLPAVAVAILFYRALEDEMTRAADERQFLL